jgi:hypothetical protein
VNEVGWVVCFVPFLHILQSAQHSVNSQLRNHLYMLQHV